MADTYRLETDGRHELIAVLDETFARGGEFVLRRVEAGDPNFIQMWEAMGGMERFDRRRRWWAEARAGFEGALA